MNEVICRQEMGGGLFLQTVYKPVRELVRCKDCKYCSSEIRDGIKFAKCELKHNWMPQAEWFCADGERQDRREDKN